MAFIRDVADGIHVITRAHTNMFLIEDQGRVLLIDAGLPAFWSDINTALTKLHVGPDAIAGVLLTHAHFDHIGCARRLHDTWHVPVWVHSADQQLATHPYSYRHELPRWNTPLTHPAGIPKLAHMTAAGALTVHGITDTTPLPISLASPAPPSSSKPQDTPKGMSPSTFQSGTCCSRRRTRDPRPVHRPHGPANRCRHRDRGQPPP
jgi:hypothetical protein